MKLLQSVQFSLNVLDFLVTQALVLARVTPKQFKTLPNPYKDTNTPSVDPDPLCSNIYSVSERILLLWLNHHYEHQRTIVWNTAPKGVYDMAKYQFVKIDSAA